MEQEPTQTTPEPTQEQTTVANESSSSNSKYVVIAVVLLLLGAGAYFAWDSGIFDAQQAKLDNPFAEQPAEQKEYPDVVANINGEDVPKDPLLQSITQTQSVAAQQGANPSDPAVQEQIEAQALDVVINTVLLIQAAEEAQIAIAPEEIDAELAQLVTQFGGQESLQAELDRIGMTEEDLRADLEEQLLISAYIEMQIDETTLAVSDAEVEAMYATFAQQNTQMPELADIQEQLREQLASQKQQEAVGQLLEELKADANVEVFI